MSGSGGGGAGKGSNVNLGVPAASRKVVRSLKEVVNCSEEEIYATLVECDMDPDAAVNRLLSQDSFHEVKSKRDKKKETKDTTESRSRGAGSFLNRGGRSNGDNYAGRGGGQKFISNESGSVQVQGKPPNKRENGTNNHVAGSSSTSSVIGRQPLSNSDPKGTENTSLPVGTCDAVRSSSQASSGLQPVWFAVPGQRTMADIVKMGRPLHQNIVTPRSSDLITSSKEPESKAPVMDEWPSIEKPDAAYSSSVFKVPMVSDSTVRADNHLKSQLDEDPVTENLPVESPVANRVRPSSVSSRNFHDDDSKGSSLYDHDNDNNNNNNETVEAYETHGQLFEHNRAEDVATTFQQLSIENDDREELSKEDRPGVIIPNHLQVHTSDCLHLMFGSFGSEMGSGLPSVFPSVSLNDNLQEIPEGVDDSSIRHPDTRDSEFYGDNERLGNSADGNLAYHIDSSARNYDSATDSETEQLKQEIAEPAHGNEFHYSSATDYAFDNNQQLNPALAPPETGPQMQNLDAFPDTMQQAYTNSPLLTSTIRDVRESDPRYSPFPLPGPAISMAEALRAANISTTGANTGPGPAALAQHLAMHPYSQPTLPLGHYTNMISYPFLPQSYPYMPSGFQQTYPQSLAAMLPQYKSSNLPQSAAVPSAYGFGASSNVPGGNFPLNQSSTGNTTMGYDNNDVLSSQFKDSNHFASIQQNESSQAWLQGQNSRVVSVVPGSTYYSFPGQNQQPPGGFRQQPSQQHFGYMSPYYSQAGMSMEHNHHHQNPRDTSVAQTHASKQAQQLWQNSY
ncbi:PREDICTED: uncharacterized protein LOC104813342 [Tarenaya hassleriana]|uniref:uncharacterized protein LOC104813342 n=1 Tax=Tarenaya hassleriana TaxID=28532 RepID=UPI00053C2E43|nr:PREDICTED: uncharacterized protein LOC104813342 [Tarenaya hassleriana]